MSALFEELDYRPTPIGLLTLRRRRDLSSGADIFEIKLGEEFLMSSMFTASEEALARLGLEAMSGDGPLDVVVGGLGLGYTAATALADDRVASLLVVDALEAVIDWHMTGLLPLGARLAGDERCRLIHGDFFTMASGPDAGFDPEEAGRRFDAILLDIDHAPGQVLHPSHAALYEVAGLTRLRAHLKDGGVFALWSNDAPDPSFTERLAGVFAKAWAEPVSFHNPIQNREAVQSVYLARR